MEIEMHIYELAAFNDSGCFRVDTFKGVEHEARARFQLYRENTIKAHAALQEAGLPADCLATSMSLVMYDDQNANDFADIAGWQLSRDADGFIVGSR